METLIKKQEGVASNKRNIITHQNFTEFDVFSLNICMLVVMLRSSVELSLLLLSEYRHGLEHNGFALISSMLNLIC